VEKKQNRLKRLDLLSGLGAGVLGAGIALSFAYRLESYAVPILLVGLIAHGWAMFAKGRLERQAQIERPKWTVVAEWACWLLLAALGIYLVAGVF
jgi:Mn2+/Fe2+ NRAMP family transporter